MKTTGSEQVFYSASAYVWCKGVSSKLGRHPIFVSSPVAFAAGPGGRYTLLKCHQATCSFCGEATPYDEKEIGFEDEILLPKSSKKP